MLAWIAKDIDLERREKVPTNTTDLTTTVTGAVLAGYK